MARTIEYTRQTSFTDAQAVNPSAPLSGPGVDAEFNRVKVSLDSTQQSLELIQRDDGALRNGVVTFDALSPGLLTGLEPAAPWQAARNYIVNNCVFFDDGSTIKLYRCLTSHTSASAFSTDLVAGRWQELVDYTPPPVTGTIPVGSGGTGATTPAGARANLELGGAAVEDVLPVTKGGTGATSAAAARTALGATTVGGSVFTAVDASAARAALGATTVGGSVFTAASAAAARGAIAAPPLPVLASGVGQWVSLSANANTALSLPAGGSWAWFYVQRNSPAGTISSTSAGISAGGSVIAGANPNLDHLGFAWRIA